LGPLCKGSKTYFWRMSKACGSLAPKKSLF
jgi:hypothetical protein